MRRHPSLDLKTGHPMRTLPGCAQPVNGTLRYGGLERRIPRLYRVGGGWALESLARQ